MSVRDIDTARIANLRACLASISAKAESAIEGKGGPYDTLRLIHDAAEAALKGDEFAGGKIASW